MRKEIVEKIQALFGVIILTLTLLVFFYSPAMHTDDMTELYSTYNEIKDYTEISELEKYLNENNIRYEMSVGDIYVYPSSYRENKIQFITLGNACEIIPAEYAINFQKIDKKENVEITHKNGNEYIYHIKDGKKYVCYEGKYYTTIAHSLFYKFVRVIVTIIVALADILLIYIAFFYKEKEHKRSSN